MRRRRLAPALDASSSTKAANWPQATIPLTPAGVGRPGAVFGLRAADHMISSPGRKSAWATAIQGRSTRSFKTECRSPSLIGTVPIRGPGCLISHTSLGRGASRAKGTSRFPIKLAISASCTRDTVEATEKHYFERSFSPNSALLELRRCWRLAHRRAMTTTPISNGQSNGQP
jgi:hypothetical protein